MERIIIPVISFGKAGGFRTLSKLSSFWVKSGYKVIFIVSDKSVPYYPTEAEIISCSSKKANSNDNVLYRLSQLFRLYKKLNSIVGQNDILLASYALTAFVISLCRKTSKRYYYIQAYEPEFFNKDIVGRLKSFFISRTYSLKLTRIVNSPIYFNYKNLKSNYCIFPGLDLELYNNSRKISKREVGGKIKVGCLWREEKWKGTQIAINAFKSFHKERSNSELHIGIFKEVDIEENDLIKCILIKNDSELVEFYKNLDVFVAPSTVQFGAVHYPVIESMACGIPLITTYYHPAHPDNSWLVYPNNVADIVTKLKIINDEPYRAYSKADRSVGDVKHLSWDLVARDMLEILVGKC